MEFAPGLDYRGAGGYVIAPPSVHENGRTYEWEVNHTPTNCAPSIHVLNSLAVNFAIQKSSIFRERRWIRTGSHILNIAIILSTMFIKQHSIVDVALGLVLGIGVYMLIYTVDWRDIWQSARHGLATERT